MGREIRMVPPNWAHPKKEYYGEMREQPMFDEHYDDVFYQWLKDFDRVRAGELTELEQKYYPRGLADWLTEDGRPPDPSYYRPWRDEEATWVQVWETVSEGTPVSPPFATKEELINYLVAYGDFWDQKRGNGGWDRKAAEEFVGAGWAPSLVVISSSKGANIWEPRDGTSYV